MKRKINHLLAFLKKPQNLILLFFVVTLGYLVLFPLVCIVKDTFVVHASEVIETAEPPVAAIRSKKDSSIVVGMKMVRREEGFKEQYFVRFARRRNASLF